MNSLFPEEEMEKLKVPPKGQCRYCIHHLKQEYRSGKRFYYCLIWKDNRTDCGFKKVKAKFGCSHFKEPEPHQISQRRK